MATCAAFIEESRMKLANPTKHNRKSEVAQWRETQFERYLSAFPVVDRRTADPSASLGMTKRKGRRLIESV
jgi:hypothetical protein